MEAIYSIIRVIQRWIIYGKKVIHTNTKSTLLYMITKEHHLVVNFIYPFDLRQILWIEKQNSRQNMTQCSLFMYDEES